MSERYAASGGASAQPENTGLRWLLAILVTGALTFTAVAVVLHGGADPTAAVVRASTTCNPARTPGAVTSSSVVNGEVSVGDTIRTYRLTLPAGYDGTKPVPMVILLHGTSGTIQSIEDYTGMVPAASQRGYAVLTPQGVGAADGSLPTHWTVPGFDPPDAADDVAYVSGLVDTVTRAYCVDASRVFATGISGGAAFATELACRTDLLAGIAPVAGLNLVPPCQNAAPLTVLAIHGTDDSLVAYDGVGADTEGMVSDDGSLPMAETTQTSETPAAESPAAETPSAPADPTAPRRPFYNGAVQADVARWAAAMGCSGSTPGQESTDVATETYTGCTQGVTVALWTVQGGGHTWPGGTTVPDGVGFQTETITATQAILDAFDTTPSTGTAVRPSV
jgi:polyhydroxybutyrate depolymerase